jgi:hypothetical protein
MLPRGILCLCRLKVTYCIAPFKNCPLVPMSWFAKYFCRKNGWKLCTFDAKHVWPLTYAEKKLSKHLMKIAENSYHNTTYICNSWPRSLLLMAVEWLSIYLRHSHWWGPSIWKFWDRPWWCAKFWTCSLFVKSTISRIDWRTGYILSKLCPGVVALWSLRPPPKQKIQGSNPARV